MPSAMRTASGNSGRIKLADESNPKRDMALLVDVTAIEGVGSTLDLSLEWTPDGGTTFFPAETADTFAQIDGVTMVSKRFECKAGDYRIVWTIAGTLPEFTFRIFEYAL